MQEENGCIIFTEYTCILLVIICTYFIMAFIINMYAILIYIYYSFLVIIYTVKKHTVSTLYL